MNALLGANTGHLGANHHSPEGAIIAPRLHRVQAGAIFTALTVTHPHARPGMPYPCDR